MNDWSSDEWKAREVRLFPTIRISSVREAELRATASLCAMIRAVSEFGRAVVQMAKGPAGRLSCYTEVEFKSDPDGDGSSLRPDAIVRVVRGKKEWKALVEVKVGDNPLSDQQVNDYHKLARLEGFDAVITISNQTALANGMPPVSLDMRRARAIPVVHLSWDRLLSEAQLLSHKKGIADSDQDWMLKEWIRYVADPTSRIITAPSLGEHWSQILQAARQGSLMSVSKHLETSVGLWDAFLRKVALRLRAKLGVDVRRRIPKADRDDAVGRTKRLTAVALNTSTLTGALRIPGAVGDVELCVNLQSRAVQFSVQLRPPTEGRNLTKINWVARQFKSMTPPKDAILRVQWSQRSVQSQGRVVDIVQDASALMRSHTGQLIGKELNPKLFVFEWTVGLKKGRGRSTAKVLDGIATALEHFYRDVVEGLTAHSPKAPQLPKAGSQESLADGSPPSARRVDADNVDVDQSTQSALSGDDDEAGPPSG